MEFLGLLDKNPIIPPTIVFTIMIRASITLSNSIMFGITLIAIMSAIAIMPSMIKASFWVFIMVIPSYKLFV